MCLGVQYKPRNALEVDVHLDAKHSSVKPMKHHCQKQKSCQLLSKIDTVKAKCDSLKSKQQVIALKLEIQNQTSH